MPPIVAIYGSPRPRGNTATLLDRAVRGARDEGALVETVHMHQLNMSPCMEIYGCQKAGRCAIDDDFQAVYDHLCTCAALMLASPIFFYTVSAHTKIIMDRCQCLWVKKYWIDREAFGAREPTRNGLFLSAGATRGKKLFDGTLLTVKYFFDVLDMRLWKTLLYRGLDLEGDVLQHPDYLQEAYDAGRALALSLRGQPS